MKLYGLIGLRLGHSFSARYFAEKFARNGLDCRYLNFELPGIDALSELLRQQPELRGFNVTIPYKEAILPCLAALTDEAREVGAVNTVRIEKGGILIGHNTDMEGFDTALGELLRDEQPSRALVLGSGGASKAVCAALSRRQIPYRIVSRKGPLTYADLTPVLVADTPLLVNATPQGMWPDVDALPDLPYQAIGARHRCFDLVYNPEETAFMAACRSRGARVCNGLRMLHLQADAAWRFWTAP